MSNQFINEVIHDETEITECQICGRKTNVMVTTRVVVGDHKKWFVFNICYNCNSDFKWEILDDFYLTKLMNEEK